MHSLKMSDLVDWVRSQYAVNASWRSGSTLNFISVFFFRGLYGILHLNCNGGTIIARIRFAYKTAKHLCQEVSLIRFFNLLGYLIAPLFMSIHNDVSPLQGLLQGDSNFPRPYGAVLGGSSITHEIVEFYTGRAVENPNLSLKDLKHLLRILNRGDRSMTGEIKYAIACQLPSSEFKKVEVQHDS